MSVFLISKTNNEILNEFYEKAMKELNVFFGINWKYNKPRVYIYDSASTADLLRDNKRESWQIGWIKGRNVYIMAKEKIGVDSPHKRITNEKEYYSLFKHELAHCFFKILSKDSIEPDWLWEGIAIYLSGQLEFRNNIHSFIRFIDIYHKESQEVYRESGFAVKLLVEKYGKEKIIHLIKSLNSIRDQKSFLIKFNEIYGFELTYDNFNKLLKDQ